MNSFLELVVDNSSVLDELLVIDNNRMGTNFDKEKFLNTISITDKKYQFSSSDNLLIIYDGNPYTTYSILNSLDNATNIILFPNYSYLGINTYLVKNYNNINDRCRLITDKNYNKFIHTKDIFDYIYVVGDNNMYELVKKDFPSVILIHT